MKVKIFGNNKESEKLLNKINISLEELGLNDFIEVTTTNSKDLKKELNITKEPALIIEEESIEFKDVLFEGIIPKDEEIKSMFISIIGGGNKADGCAPEACNSCFGGC